MRIEPHLQTLIDFLLSNFKLGHPPPRTPLKRQTRVAKASTSPLYSSFWLIDADVFQQVVSYFETITSHFLSLLSHGSIDPSIEQSIASDVISTVVAIVDAMQAKHEEKIFALREIIKRSLLLKESPFLIPLLSPVATLKVHPGGNSLLKTTTKR